MNERNTEGRRKREITVMTNHLEHMRGCTTSAWLIFHACMQVIVLTLPAGSSTMANAETTSPQKAESGKSVSKKTERLGSDTTLPSGTVPGGTVPGGTLPGGPVPGGTVPGGTVSGGTVPGGTLPGGTPPGGPVPGGTVPGGTVPGGTVPGGTLP